MSRTRCGILMPRRRAGTVPTTGVRYGPGSAAHHAVKNGALRCVRGTSYPALFRCDGAAICTMGGLAFSASTWKPATRL